MKRALTFYQVMCSLILANVKYVVFQIDYFFNISGKNEGGKRDEENTNDHEATPLLSNQNTVLITHGEGK